MFADRTLRAYWAEFTGRALRAGWALEAWFAGGTGRADRTAFALRAGRTLQAVGASRAGFAIDAIAHSREPIGDQAHEVAAQLGEVGPQFGDGRLRLRLDQHALALPLPALAIEHLTERLAPGLKQTVGGVRSGRHWQTGFGPLVQCHRDCPLAAARVPALAVTHPVRLVRLARAARPGSCRPG